MFTLFTLFIRFTHVVWLRRYSLRCCSVVIRSLRSRYSVVIYSLRSYYSIVAIEYLLKIYRITIELQTTHLCNTVPVGL